MKSRVEIPSLPLFGRIPSPPLAPGETARSLYVDGGDTKRILLTISHALDQRLIWIYGRRAETNSE